MESKLGMESNSLMLGHDCVRLYIKSFLGMKSLIEKLFSDHFRHLHYGTNIFRIIIFMPHAICIVSYFLSLASS